MTKKKDPKDILKTGRPTLYKPEYAQKLKDYFTQTSYNMTTDKNEKDYAVSTRFPTLEGFAVFEIGVSKSVLHDWKNAFDVIEDDEGGSIEVIRYPEFLEAYNFAKSAQAHLIQEGAMIGAYSAAFSNKAATNIMDWRDKQEVTLEATVDLNAKVQSLDMTPEEAARHYLDMMKKDE